MAAASACMRLSLVLPAASARLEAVCAMPITGDDSEIDVAHPAGGQPQEFFDWRWETLARTPQLVTPFKQATYEKVAAAFAHLVG